MRPIGPTPETRNKTAIQSDCIQKDREPRGIGCAPEVKDPEAAPDTARLGKDTPNYMPDRILINREECEVRVAFLEGQELVELHTEKFDDVTIVNNIYRGRVQDVVPGLQAAFIDVGLPRNMFLHFMDIRPESLVLGSEDQQEALREASEKVIPGRIEQRGRRPRQDPRAPQAASPVKKGDQIIVQVVKDEIGGKAPRVTTNLSIAGRYLVMLPFPSQEGGVSRKIAVGQDRYRLKKLLSSLKTEDHSFIVRTAGMEQPEEAIQNDAENLFHIWATILERYRKINGPGLLHNDHDLIGRMVRDAFPPEFGEVVCDDPEDAREVRTHLGELMSEGQDKVREFDKDTNIFEYFGVEKQIEKALDRKYWLPSGGYLIIDENEALTAIDVNTGRFTGKKDQEKTSLKTNMEACEAIATQIRLRDIGGIIVIDFIDMLSRTHQERVSEELKKHLKRDRAKTAVGKVGDFGILVMTRKRQRMSLINQVFEECPYCRSSGFVKHPDEMFRRLRYDVQRTLAQDARVNCFVVSANPRLIERVVARYRSWIERMRAEKRTEIIFRGDDSLHFEDFQLTPIRRNEQDSLHLPARRIDDETRILAMTESSLIAEDSAPPRPRDEFEDDDAEFDRAMTPAPAQKGGQRHRHERPARPARPERPQAPPPHPPAAVAKPVEPLFPGEEELEDEDNIGNRIDGPYAHLHGGGQGRGGRQQGQQDRPDGNGGGRRRRRRRGRGGRDRVDPVTGASISGDDPGRYGQYGPPSRADHLRHQADQKASHQVREAQEIDPEVPGKEVLAPAPSLAGQPAVAGEPGTGVGEGEGKRKTRRGSRGGRNRRRNRNRQDQEAVPGAPLGNEEFDDADDPISGEPEGEDVLPVEEVAEALAIANAAAPAPAPEPAKPVAPPAPPPKLSLPLRLVRRDETIVNVLELIEKQVESLKGVVAATSAPAAAAPQSPAAPPAEPVLEPVQGDLIESIAPSPVVEEKKRPARKPRPARPAESVAPAAPPAAPAATPKKKEPTKPAKAAAAKSAKEPAAAEKTAKGRRKPAAEPAAPADQPKPTRAKAVSTAKKAPAAKETKPAKPAKSPTGRSRNRKTE